MQQANPPRTGISYGHLFVSWLLCFLSYSLFIAWESRKGMAQNLGILHSCGSYSWLWINSVLAFAATGDGRYLCLALSLPLSFFVCLSLSFCKLPFQMKVNKYLKKEYNSWQFLYFYLSRHLPSSF